MCVLVTLMVCALTVATACDQLKVEQTPSFEEVQALHHGGEVAVALQGYRALAEAGHPGAQNALGDMYFKGEGVPKDETEAVRWALLAAEQGDTDLLMDFANAYFQGPSSDGTGNGVPKDETEGMRLRRLAAEHGDEGAQRAISEDYFHGRGRYAGEPLRYVYAYAWLDTASAALDVSTEDRSEIVDMMSGDETEQALALSRQYRAKHVKAAARCGDGKQVRATLSEAEGTSAGSRVTLMFEFDCAVPQPDAAGRFIKRTATGTSSTSVVMDGTTTIRGSSLGDLFGGLLRSSMRQMAMSIVPFEVVSADGNKVVVRLSERETPGPAISPIQTSLGAALAGPGSEVVLTLDRGAGPEDGPPVVADEACNAWNTREFFKNATVQEVRDCLDDGADTGAANALGQTPLHLSAWYDENAAVARALLDAGADASAVDKLGLTPLHEVAKFGNNEMVKALLDAGADASAVDKLGETPLHNAARAKNNEAVKALLDAGADAGVVNDGGQTPLDLAEAGSTGRAREVAETIRAALATGIPTAASQ